MAAARCSLSARAELTHWKRRLGRGAREGEREREREREKDRERRRVPELFLSPSVISLNCRPGEPIRVGGSWRRLLCDRWRRGRGGEGDRGTTWSEDTPS